MYWHKSEEKWLSLVELNRLSIGAYYFVNVLASHVTMQINGHGIVGGKVLNRESLSKKYSLSSVNRWIKELKKENLIYVIRSKTAFIIILPGYKKWIEDKYHETKEQELVYNKVKNYLIPQDTINPQKISEPNIIKLNYK